MWSRSTSGVSDGSSAVDPSRASVGLHVITSSVDSGVDAAKAECFGVGDDIWVRGLLRGLDG